MGLSPMRANVFESGFSALKMHQFAIFDRRGRTKYDLAATGNLQLALSK